MVAWFKHDIPAWMDGTESLSDGAYRAYHVICQLIYLNEGPIALNEHGIAGRCRQSIRAFRRNLEELLASGKLRLENGRLANSRADKELEKVGENRINASEGGKNSGKSRNAPSKPLKSKDQDKATLQNDRSLKTRLEETRLEKTAAAQPVSGVEDKSAVQACVDIVKIFNAVGLYEGDVPDTGRVYTWQAQGWDLKLCVSVVRERCRPGKRVGTLAFFDEAIREAHAKRNPTPVAKAEIPWAIHAKNWAKSIDEGMPFWPPALGPDPTDKGCRCPPDILRQHGIDPASGKKSIEPAAA